MLFGCRLNTTRTTYEIGEDGFCLDTRSARAVATGQGWYLFGTREEALDFGESQVAAQASGAFNPYPPPPPGPH